MTSSPGLTRGSLDAAPDGLGQSWSTPGMTNKEGDSICPDAALAGKQFADVGQVLAAPKQFTIEDKGRHTENADSFGCFTDAFEALTSSSAFLAGTCKRPQYSIEADLRLFPSLRKSVLVWKSEYLPKNAWRTNGSPDDHRS